MATGGMNDVIANRMSINVAIEWITHIHEKQLLVIRSRIDILGGGYCCITKSALFRNINRDTNVWFTGWWMLHKYISQFLHVLLNFVDYCPFYISIAASKKVKGDIVHALVEKKNAFHKTVIAVGVDNFFIRCVSSHNNIKIASSPITVIMLTISKVKSKSCCLHCSPISYPHPPPTHHSRPPPAPTHPWT